MSHKKIITSLSEIDATQSSLDQREDQNQEQNSVASRRRFLQGFATACALSTIPSFVLAGEIPRFSPVAQNSRPEVGPAVSPASTVQGSDFWSRPRVVNIKRYQNNERLHVVYWRDGKFDVDGYQRICWLMRDLRGGNATRSIDPRLLDLICAMQAWVGQYGYTKPFQISSGYRSPHTNANTENAAKNSMHMYGRAADIIIPELPVNYLGRLAQHYAAGGVGFYPSNGFVHIDTGRIRTWTGGKRRR